MKRKGINKATVRIAVCGVVSAMCVALIMLSGIMPFGTFALPCFAGIILTAIVIEYGTAWALGAFAVVSVLSLLLSADKEAGLFFVMIFGYYPILKNLIERKILSRIVQYILKFAVFNVAVIIASYIATFVLAVSDEEYTIFGLYVPWAFLVAGNLFLLLYDRAVSLFVIQYVQKLRGKIFGKK